MGNAIYLLNLIEKLTLSSYDEYLKKVGEAYMARPAFEQQYVSSWTSLINHIEKLFNQIKDKIEFTDQDTYGSAKEMGAAYKETGKLKIWTGASEHPVWTPEQNWKFRAVHDYYGHVSGMASGGHRFSKRGEINVYNRQARMAPPDARLALFTEIVGQLGGFYLQNSNVEQKVCKLWGFDYVNVGDMDETEYAKNFESALIY